MRIDPFGYIEYKSKDKEWFGLVENIAPYNKVELSICSQNINLDIRDKIETLRRLANDYNSISTNLYELVYQAYKNSKWEKTFDEIKEMYFLTAVTLKGDNNTWWLVLEPDFKVDSIYNHFLRFTMIEREIIWTNFTT